MITDEDKSIVPEITFLFAQISSIMNDYKYSVVRKCLEYIALYYLSKSMLTNGKITKLNS
ncbi:CGH_1_HP_G0064580.mRNA.1.CDS.1 [Saccharomyces cerevisiae]|nr:CGH_1_HP_G0064580.mRNA.1.CDS.1 [Saccharomyces cerevisiae]CAI6851270.1 CGH_1_HP_G0064580.mRNA.1.CDS.1 [Saccharomyces cerevisiae]